MKTIEEINTAIAVRRSDLKSAIEAAQKSVATYHGVIKDHRAELDALPRPKVKRERKVAK